MKRRPKAQARRLQRMRRHRSRRRPRPDFTLGADPGWVSATVFYTEPFAAGGTAAWLEPEAHDPRAPSPWHF